MLNIVNLNMEPNKKSKKRGRLNESSSDEEFTGYSRVPTDHWPEYLLIQGNGEELIDNPFLTAKTIKSVAGEVKEVKRLRNGELLVHCATRSQSLNLLKLKSFAGIPCKVTPHKSLNSSKGIVRDKERCLR